MGNAQFLDLLDIVLGEPVVQGRLKGEQGAQEDQNRPEKAKR